MFTLDASRQFLQVKPQAIIALYQSVNSTTVYVPGRASAMAQAVICGYRGTGTGYAVSVALHLTETGQHLLYVHDADVLDAEGAREAAKEAIQFVESMGFFVENLNWRQRDATAQAELVASLKVFQPPEEHKVQAAARVVDPRTRLARLLVQI